MKTLPKTKITKPADRRAIPVDQGNLFNSITSVRKWFKAGLFANRDEALGAFKLAHQQALDGLGPSHHEWMGFTSEKEFHAWMRDETLPTRR